MSLFEIKLWEKLTPNQALYILFWPQKFSSFDWAHAVLESFFPVNQVEGVGVSGQAVDGHDLRGEGVGAVPRVAQAGQVAALWGIEKDWIKSQNVMEDNKKELSEIIYRSMQSIGEIIKVRRGRW